MFGYDVIVADPPWDFENYSDAGTRKGADPHYDVMSLGNIKALRVGELARRDALLLMWATECMRPQAQDVMQAWDFTYKSAFIWRKLTINGKPRMGTGYRVRSMHEPVLLGTNGNPKHGAFPSIFDGVARETFPKAGRVLSPGHRENSRCRPV
jgi:N6-adenosine-specific RNA methylase IME4